MIRSNICPWAADQRTKTQICDMLRGWFLLKIRWQWLWVLFVQMQFYFDVDVHFNRRLWSQGWLAVTANKLAPSVSLLAGRILHEQCVSMQTEAASGLTPCCLCVCKGKRREQKDGCGLIHCVLVCRCKFVFILTLYQWVEALTNQKHAFPSMQPSRHSYGNNKIKNNNSNQRNLHSNVKDYKVHFNYSFILFIIHWDFKPTQYGLIFCTAIPQQPLMRTLEPDKAGAKHSV